VNILVLSFRQGENTVYSSGGIFSFEDSEFFIDSEDQGLYSGMNMFVMAMSVVAIQVVWLISRSKIIML
jgi:hypothetical protein